MSEHWITVEPHTMDKLFAALEARTDEIHKAGGRAVGKVGAGLRIELVRAVSRYTGIAQRQVRKRFVWQKRKGLPPMTSRVTVSGHGAPLIQLRARQTKKGVRYRPYGGDSGWLASGFIREGIWRRSVFLRAGKERLPIKAQYGPSIAEGIRSHIPAILSRAADRLQREVERIIAKVVRTGKA